VKDKHIQIRIEQCLALAKASNCPRRKFGALLLDPDRNVVLMDGYNGGPRGGGELCGGSFCLRDGVSEEDIHLEPDGDYPDCFHAVHTLPDGSRKFLSHEGYTSFRGTDEAHRVVGIYLRAYPPIQSGTEIQIGCHHAEMNVICNAAANGVPTRGAWLIVTGEPCLMCAKLIHHAGIAKVLVVKGGYAGSNGMDYLKRHKIGIQFVGGPQDPRMRDASRSDVAAGAGGSS